MFDLYINKNYNYNEKHENINQFRSKEFFLLEIWLTFKGFGLRFNHFSLRLKDFDLDLKDFDLD